MFHRAFDLAAESDHRIFHYAVFADIFGRCKRIARMNFLRCAAHVEHGIFIQQIHIRLPERSDRAHIFPVALETIGKHPFPRFQHCGQHVFSEVLRRIGIFIVLFQIFKEFFRRENINSHGGEIVFGYFRFFLEFVNRSVGIRI